MTFTLVRRIACAFICCFIATAAPSLGQSTGTLTGVETDGVSGQFSQGVELRK